MHTSMIIWSLLGKHQGLWEAGESSAALFDILSGYILVNLECSMFLTSLAPKKTSIIVAYCRVKVFFIVADWPYYK